MKRIGDDEDDEAENQCPMCSGPGVPLGALGQMEWFRCRDCGWQYGDRPQGTMADEQGDPRIGDDEDDEAESLRDQERADSKDWYRNRLDP